MAEQNGSVKGKKAPRITNGKANGHTPMPRRIRATAGAATWRSFMMQNVLRLLMWYAIATVIFRCPSTIEECDDNSPAICKTYFQAKSAVAPHVEPYFDAYAAPYIEIASPYVNAFSHNVVVPTRTFVVHHGAPRLAQAQAFAQAQWTKTGKPQVEKLQTVVKEQYRKSLGPHVDRAGEAISPYLDIARTSALQTFYEVVLPSYDLVKPYVVQTYNTAAAFTTEIAIPSASWAFNRTYMFLDDNVLPHLRAIYVENVEPQLIRIGERLGRYKGTPSASPKKSAATSRASEAKASVSGFSKPVQPVKSVAQDATKGKKLKDIFSSKTSSTDSTSTSETASADAAESVPAVANEKPSKEEILRIAQETVAEDLEQWQTKFANAADEGAAEIENKVDEISKRFRETRLDKEGLQLVSQLQRAADEELEKLKREIVAVVSSTSDDIDAAADKVVAAVRRTGLAIKGKAEDVRNWREQFEQEIHAEVTGAVQEHFNILGSIRDLALQKIGMKWAWMDGITYKDWAKYHEMKKRFDAWTDDLQQLIVTHPGLEETMNAAAEIEDQAMGVAQSAAQELGRLKQVAGWKIQSGDETDNFDTDAMRQAAEEAAEATAERASAESAEAQQEQEQEQGQETVTESESEPTGAPVSDTEPGRGESEAAEPHDEIVEEVLPSSHVDGAPVEADTVIVPSVEEIPTQGTENSAESGQAEESIPDAADVPESSSSSVVEEPAMGTDQSLPVDPLPEIADNITEAKSSPDAASEEQVGDIEVDDEAEPDEAPEEQVASPSVHQETASVKPAFLGAAAQVVPGREPILDDDEDAVATATSMVQSAYSSAISRASMQFSIAMSVVSAQISGTPKPVHEQMFASVSSAYSAAVASASSKMEEAVDAVQGGALRKPTQTPSPVFDWAAVESMANVKLEEGRVWAEQQYESAKIVLGLATPTPTAPSEKLLEQAKMNYYAGLGFAHARYSEFMLAASSAMYSLTATATPTPTNVAESASSIASVVSESVEDAASSVSSVASVVGESVNNAYEEAGDALAQSWEVVVSHISVQVYGAPTPTPWYESLYSMADSYRSPASDGASSFTNAAASYASSASGAAAEQYSAVSSIVSELILGKDPPFTESVFSRLNSAYSLATASAGSAASAASSAASAAASAVKESVEHVRDEL